MVLLSVVIISRNEEQNIARCIESVLDSVKDIDHEIILVDSASTDNTIDIAKKYPLTIYQLRPEWPLSASAGRYIGFTHACGKFIQFQDCDTIINKEWFKYSILFLEDHPEIAGAVGIITQEDYNNEESKKWIEASKIENLKIGEIQYFSGDSLLRKNVLDEIGPFNPYLKATEEGELCDRLKYKGLKLEMLPIVMSHHFGYNEGFYGNFKKKANFAFSAGQILRLSHKNKKIFIYRLNIYKFILSMCILMLFFFVALIYMFLTNIQTYLYIWAIGLVILFMSIFYEKWSFRYSMIHFFSILIRWPYFLKGLLVEPRDPITFPSDVKIIKNNT